MNDSLRTADAVAKRCIALMAIVLAGHSTFRGELVTWLEDQDLLDELSPWEEEFMWKHERSC